MNILLTGSNGYIGKNLKDFLKEKYRLLCPKSSELNLCNTDKVKEYFKNNKIDFIIHCASKGGVRGVKDKDTTLEDNLKMVNNLIEFKKSDTRIILFGSGAMYGKDRDLIKVKENEIGKYIPKDLYGISKLEISKITQKRDDILCLNIFGCYGYNEKETRFPTYAINCVLNNKPIEINKNVIFDYLFIEDLEKIIDYFILNKPKDKIINVTPSQSISLYEISEIINSFNKKQEIKILNEGMNYQYTGDNSLLIKNYPDIMFTKYDEGLLKLCRYIKNRYNSEVKGKD